MSQSFYNPEEKPKSDVTSTNEIAPKVQEDLCNEFFQRAQSQQKLCSPTPLGLGGILLALTPLSIDLMGWRGASGDGAAQIGAIYFLGGLIAIIASIGEFFLCNAFSMVVFGIHGGFFLAYGATLQPSFNAYNAYASNNPLDAQLSPRFLSSIGFLLLFMAVATFVMLICSFQTNLIFLLMFLTLDIAFCFIAASDFYGAYGSKDIYLRYRVIAGAFFFSASAFGWYMFVSLMLVASEFPFTLPLGEMKSLLPKLLKRFKNKSKPSVV